MLGRKLCIWTVVSGLLVSALPVWAMTTTSSSRNNTWETATRLSLERSSVIFGSLGGQGDVRFVSFPVELNQAFKLTLSTTDDSSQTFDPRLVVFLPDTTLVGPVLPFAQPPTTMALVYGNDTAKRIVDARTQTVTMQLLQTTVPVTTSGTAYVAIYNADRSGGRYRLDVSSDTSKAASWVSWPTDWWRAQTWAGLTSRTLLFPAGVIGLAVLVLALVKVRQRMRVKVPVS